MKKITSLIICLIICVTTAFAATPVITVVSNKALGTTVSFQFRASAASTPIQVDFGNGTLVNFTIGTASTAVSGALVSTKTVKVYGSNLTWFVCPSNELTGISVANLPTLQRLECGTNSLTSINLTQNTNLVYLDCRNNLLTGLNVTANTKLQILIANTNPSLGAINVAANTALVGLHLRATGITTVDVSKNTLLTDFDCGNNSLTTLDVSKNTALTSLRCNGNSLDTINVEANTALTTLDCSNNYLGIGTLPIKKAAWTTYTYAPQRNIVINAKYGVAELIDLSKHLNAANGTSSTFYAYTTGGASLIKETDFTYRNGQIVMKKEFLNGVYFSIANTAFPDFTGANCLLTSNTIIEAFPLGFSFTTSAAVGTSLNFPLSCNYAAFDAAIKVDFGDGVLKDFTINTNGTSITGTLGANKTIKVYGTSIKTIYISSLALTSIDVSRLYNLESINLAETGLGSLNISNNTKLNELISYNNPYVSIDLSNNPLLAELVLFGDSLTSLDISKQTLLKKLSISGKKILNFDFSKNTLLERLSIGGNHNDLSLDLSNNTKLKNFYCTYRNLKNLDLSKLTALELIEFSYCNITNLNLSKNTNLTYLGLPFNDLTTLDVSNNVKLKRIVVPWNKLTSLDVSNCTQLNELWASNNLFTGIDLSKNIEITSIVLDWNDIIALDLSKNTKLTHLDASYNELTSLDLTANTSITELTCVANKISALDVSKMLNLEKLECGNNLINTLDVSKNTKLNYLNCSYNNMASLNLTNNTALTNVNIQANKLNFVTIPPKKPTYTTYWYGFQKYYVMPKNFKVGEVIDLSSQLTRDGVTTSYIWKSYNNVALVAGTDYTVSGGKTTFLKSFTDSVRCEMTNAALPDFNNSPFSTSFIKINEAPVVPGEITFTTAKTVGSELVFYMKANVASTPIQIDFGNGTLVNYTVNTTDTKITGNVAGSGTLKITGSGINYFYASNDQITTINVSKCQSLKGLDLTNNSLTAIDISTNTGLTRFSCTSNTISALDVTKNVLLTSLSCGNNSLTSIDVSKNVELTSFSCGNNNLTSLDVTKNTKLQQLYFPDTKISAINLQNNTTLTTISCYNNSLTTIDVSKCTLLGNLFCSKNKLTSIDVSKNTYLSELHCESNLLTSLNVSTNLSLQYLLCTSNQLTTLDVSKNVYLVYLRCSMNKLGTLNVSTLTRLTELKCYGNNLTTLDLSKNTALTTLDCSSNKLTSLNLDNNTALTNVEIIFNNFNIATIPAKKNYYTTYNYTPQNEYTLAKNIKKGTVVDLSSQLTRNGNTTSYTWRINNIVTLVAGTDYTISGGKTTFLKSFTDSVRCEMKNADLPDLNTQPYYTNFVKINEADVVEEITMTTAKAVGTELAFYFKANIANTAIKIDFGNGTLVNHSIGTSSTKITGNVAGNGTIKIVGNEINTFSTSHNQITTIDVSKCKSLKDLDVSSNTLTTINLTSNPGLTAFGCTTNNISTLDVTKNVSLTYLSCANNKLSTIDVSKNVELTSFSCWSNNLTNLDLSKNTKVDQIYCERNQLTSLNLQSNTALRHLSCNNNKLTNVDVSKCTQLNELHCENNLLANIDISKNTSLTAIVCGYNRLTSLNVSANLSLNYLFCEGNELSTIDISKNNALLKVRCQENNFDFTTLPLKQASWTEYEYANQKALKIAKSTKTNVAIDLSKQLTINGNTTTYVWKTQAGTILEAGTDYSISGGITTFLKSFSDSVYCEMTNATFPDFTNDNKLRTSNIFVENSTSINKINKENTIIYAKNNSIYVEVKQPSQVKIFDIQGRKITEKQVSGFDSINLQISGIYIVHLQNNSETISKKLIIK